MQTTNYTTIEIDLANKVIGRLTTEHAASSYGIPVLVLNCNAYGPGDVLPETGLKAGESVLASFDRAVILGRMAGDHVAAFTGKRFPTVNA